MHIIHAGTVDKLINWSAGTPYMRDVRQHLLLMRTFTLIISLTFVSAHAAGQNSIPQSVTSLVNQSIIRVGHRPPSFTVDKRILKRVKGHKREYSEYFLEQLPDTSKTIVAHLLLVKMWGDSVSVGERAFVNEDNGQSGFEFSMNGLKFRKYLSGKYLVDIESMKNVRNKWIEILDK